MNNIPAMRRTLFTLSFADGLRDFRRTDCLRTTQRTNLMELRRQRVQLETQRPAFTGAQAAVKPARCAPVCNRRLGTPGLLKRPSRLKHDASRATKIGWSRLASLPCSFSCYLVIHVGRNELDLLAQSLCCNQLVPGHLPAADCNYYITVFDHGCRGRGQSLGAWREPAPGRISYVEDNVDTAGQLDVVFLRLGRDDTRGQKSLLLCYLVDGAHTLGSSTGLHSRTGLAVWLLPERRHHDRQGLSGQEARSHRRRNPAGALRRPVPLFHTCAHASSH